MTEEKMHEWVDKGRMEGMERLLGWVESDMNRIRKRNALVNIAD